MIGTFAALGIGACIGFCAKSVHYERKARGLCDREDDKHDNKLKRVLNAAVNSGLEEYRKPQREES